MRTEEDLFRVRLRHVNDFKKEERRHHCRPSYSAYEQQLTVFRKRPHLIVHDHFQRIDVYP
ncbi:MAG: hypothetical protein WC248_04020, partial [Candidatus Methanomethylophilaceae archaeon]